MKEEITKKITSKGLKYKDSDYFNDSVVGKEITRFPFDKKQYRGHKLKYMGDIYFDDYIMDEMKRLAEENSKRTAPYFTPKIKTEQNFPDNVDGDITLYDFLEMIESKGYKLQIVDENGKIVSRPEVIYE